MFFSYESYVLMSIPFREIRGIITKCVFSGRCTQRPYPPHSSLLKSRCRFPSLQTADVCGTSEYHGFKNPRLFALSGIASFRRHYLYIITEKRKRLEDVNMNSRGLLSPRFLSWKKSSILQKAAPKCSTIV